MMTVARLQLVVADDALRRQAEALAAALMAAAEAVAEGGSPLAVDVVNSAAAAKGQGERIALLQYSQAETLSPAFRQLAQISRCCVVLNVHSSFPFLPALRRRMEAVLGQVERIEVMAAEGGVQSAAARLVEKLAEERVEAQVAAPVAAPAAEKQETDNSPAAGHLLLFAEMIHFPLVDIYHRLAAELPASVVRPQPLDEAAALTCDKITAVIQQANCGDSRGESSSLSAAEQEDVAVVCSRFAAVCLLLLVTRTGGAVSKNYTHLRNAHQVIRDEDAAFAPLKKFILLLMAEALTGSDAKSAFDLLGNESLEWFPAANLAAAADADHATILLQGLFLRISIAILEQLKQDNEKARYIVAYRDMLRQLSDEQVAVIEPAGAGAQLRRLRRDLEDVL